MNRRNFLKSLATACGAAVVAPAVLLKSKCKHNYRWLAVRNSDAPVWVSQLEYDKHHHYEYTCTLCKFTKKVYFPKPKPIIVPRQNLTIAELRASGRYKTIGPYYISDGRWYDFKIFKSEGDRITYRKDRELPT